MTIVVEAANGGGHYRTLQTGSFGREINSRLDFPVRIGFHLVPVWFRVFLNPAHEIRDTFDPKPEPSRNQFRPGPGLIFGRRPSPGAFGRSDSSLWRPLQPSCSGPECNIWHGAKIRACTNMNTNRTARSKHFFCTPGEGCQSFPIRAG